MHKLTHSALALVLTFVLSAAPILAQTSDEANKQKNSSEKKLKPLEDKLDPQMIGKRDINKGQMNFYSLDKELALGRQLAAETDRTLAFVNDPVINEFVNRITQNIVLNSDSKVPFTVKVVDSEEINAFALPGGNLYVNRGLIQAADNEAELAGVMAHEIAHVAARHGVEQASKGQFANYASIPLIFLGGWGGYIVNQVAGLAVPLTFLRFSRGAEKEADLLGAQYMWKAGYDPNAMLTFFEKIQEKNRKKPSAISKAFSTHPLTEDRIKEVQKLLVRFPERAEYEVSSSEFNQVKSRLTAASGKVLIPSADAGRRPTLKRRPTSDSGSDSGVSDSTSDDNAPARPTLKRRSADTSESSSESSESGSSSGSSSESTTSSTGTQPVQNDRPTLKRKPDSLN
jgi:predicted Zn-dependent protease